MNNLPEERLAQELEKALVQADEARRFFEVLDEVDALETTFPELHALKSVPAGPKKYHSEGSALEHSLRVLQEMKFLRPDDELALLMALGHDLGKGLTSHKTLPSHPAHAKRGVDVVNQMAERLSMSNEQENAMKEASRYHMQMNDITELRESTVLDMVQNVDNLYRLILLAVADGRGREPQTEFDREMAERRLSAAQQADAEWTGQRLIDEGYDPDEMGGSEFGDLLRQKRVEQMREIETDGKELSR